MTTNSAVAVTNTLAEGLRDIKGPTAPPTGWEWLWWALAVMALGALLAGLLIFILTRRRQIAVPPTIPPHIRAMERLMAALGLIREPKPFVIAVSDTLRTYLEERFELRAPEQTTQEFLHELQHTELLPPDQKASLGEFLMRCDLVKFAKYEPEESELRRLHGAAVQFVMGTEPQPDLDERDEQRDPNRGMEAGD